MTTDRGSLEISAVQVGKAIGGALPPGTGFALLVFDFGGKGNLAYVSNADREDMLRALREFIEKSEAGQAPSVFGGKRN